MAEPERCMYLVHCLDDISCGMVDKGDRFGGSVKRMSVYMEHKAYQGQTSDPNSDKYVRKIAAGPLESEDGKYMIGSAFILYATKAEAEAFNQNDPFYSAGVWEKITITKWISIPNGIKKVNMHKDGDDMSSIKMLPEF